MSEKAWETTKKYSSAAYTRALKPGLEKVYETVDKFDNQFLSTPNSAGTEAFKATSVSQDSETAARVLRSFCKDGFYVEVDDEQAQRATATRGSLDSPQQQQQRVLRTIPDQVMREAKGLAIFTITKSASTALDAGGSGILVGRNQDTGEWSPPSGIVLQTASLKFLPGVDVYDGVAVINTYRALQALTSLRCTMGDDVATKIGPIELGETWDMEARKRQDVAWTYLKSRAFYAAVQVDGTVVIERTDENDAFYRERISVGEILAGKAKNPPKEKYRTLVETIKAAQGDEFDEDYLPVPLASPGDLRIETETRQFGIPDVEDPDPYGVKALQAEGLEIREAGTQSRPRPDTFSFKPAATSPIYPNYRKSVEMHEQGNSWRGSMLSIASVDRATQTTEGESTNANHSPSKKDSSPASFMRKDSARSQDYSAKHDDCDGENSAAEKDGGAEDETEKDIQPEPKRETLKVAETEMAEEGLHDDIEDLKTFPQPPSQIRTAVPVVARARMVTVPKRVPPSLPPRNPNRNAAMKDNQENDDDPGSDSLGGVGDHSSPK